MNVNIGKEIAALVRMTVPALRERERQGLQCNVRTQPHEVIVGLAAPWPRVHVLRDPKLLAADGILI